jgi:hypothetical protein
VAADLQGPQWERVNRHAACRLGDAACPARIVSALSIYNQPCRAIQRGRGPGLPYAWAINWHVTSLSLPLVKRLPTCMHHWYHQLLYAWTSKADPRLMHSVPMTRDSTLRSTGAKYGCNWSWCSKLATSKGDVWARQAADCLHATCAHLVRMHWVLQFQRCDPCFALSDCIHGVAFQEPIRLKE